ncbi:hypothetical protein NsoK4_05630 [Nitrosopumilus sp. K4]|uniref:hypothetical protein n=1 Tax=Nitrosopumilus sp. K4 TaxID=2795383 RepID=UPI001BABC26B|nr:hypothetical protein [Nitrosopumilus sp. K4]QUC63944.1 hypothetical protein NsoK4_05630 [Nitrosopumilus sp. K4]
MTEIDSLKKENEDLKKLASLLLAEIELIERITQIKENFTNSPDSMRIIEPILDRVSKIKDERKVLQSCLDLK